MRIEIEIKAGDTLRSLAAKWLGSAHRWVDLWKINEPRIVAEQRRYPEARRHMKGPG